MSVILKGLLKQCFSFGFTPVINLPSANVRLTHELVVLEQMEAPHITG